METIAANGAALIEHYLNDDFWDLNPPEFERCLEYPKEEEVMRLNLGELVSPQKFVLDLDEHPDIHNVDYHNFGSYEVIIFRCVDPRGLTDLDLYHPDRYYKFDIWQGQTTSYELCRWIPED